MGNVSRTAFILLAETLRESSPEGALGDIQWLSGRELQWDNDVQAIATCLQKLNARFNREKFLEACRGEGL